MRQESNINNFTKLKKRRQINLLKKINKIFTKQYGIYHLRWQISALVMMPIMIVLQSFGFPLWLNLSIGQFFGALIFWNVDKYIFKNHNSDNMEDALEQVFEPSVSTRKL